MTHTTTLIDIAVYKGDLFSNVKKSVSGLLVARSWQSSDYYQNRVPADKCHMTVPRSLVYNSMSSPLAVIGFQLIAGSGPFLQGEFSLLLVYGEN